MKFLGFIFKLLVKIVAAIMIVALLLVAISLFVTPSTFGLEELEINGVTIEEQGLADTTFYNIGKIALGILIVEHEESVSEESYISVVQKLPEVVSQSSDASIVSSQQSFTALVSNRLYFEEEVEVELESSELAALMNMAVHGESISLLAGISSFSAVDFSGVTLLAVEMESGDTRVNLSDAKVDISDAEEYFDMSESEIIKIMQDYDCEFLSITPTSYGDIVYLETKVRFTLPDDVVSEVNGLGVITISESVYVTFNSEYNLSGGELTCMEMDSSTMKLNSLSSSDTSTVASSMMGIFYGEVVDGEEVLTEYNNDFSNIMGSILNNLGEVQSVDDGTVVIKTRTE